MSLTEQHVFLCVHHHHHIQTTNTTQYPSTNSHVTYPDSLAVGPDVGRGPVGEALDMQCFPLVEAAFIWRLGPVMEQAVHLQQLAARQRHLDAHSARRGEQGNRETVIV